MDWTLDSRIHLFTSWVTHSTKIRQTPRLWWARNPQGKGEENIPGCGGDLSAVGDVHRMASRSGSSPEGSQWWIGVRGMREGNRRHRCERRRRRRACGGGEGKLSACHPEHRMWRRALTLEVENPLIGTIHGTRRRSLGDGEDWLRDWRRLNGSSRD